MSQMALLHYSITNSARQLSCPCVHSRVMVLGSCINIYSEYLTDFFFMQPTSAFNLSCKVIFGDFCVVVVKK